MLLFDIYRLHFVEEGLFGLEEDITLDLLGLIMVSLAMMVAEPTTMQKIPCYSMLVTTAICIHADMETGCIPSGLATEVVSTIL